MLNHFRRVSYQQLSPFFRLARSLASQSKPLPMAMTTKYPEVRRDETVVESLHGVTVKDPYRWLEDPDSEETQKFVQDQVALTDPYLKSSPLHPVIKERLTQLWNFPRYSCPKKHGSRYFFSKNSGLQNQSVVYMQTSLDAEPSVFFDPNTLSEDGTVALTGSAFSEDGEIFAYGLSYGGSDWQKIRFKKVATGEEYPEVLEKVKFSSIAWTHDNKGIFYMCYKDQEGRTDGSETTSNENQKMYYHAVGTDQSQDVLVLDFPENPKWRMSCEVSDCGKYLIVTVELGCEDQLLYFADLSSFTDGINGRLPVHGIVTKFEADFEFSCYDSFRSSKVSDCARYLIVTVRLGCQYHLVYFTDLSLNQDGIKGRLEFHRIVDKLEADYTYITNTGPHAVFLTNKNAPRKRLVVIDFENYAEENWKVLVPEHEKDVLDWAACVAESKLLTCYLVDAKNELQLRHLETGNVIREFSLEMGTVGGFSGKKKLHEFFYLYTSFLSPSIIYRCDLGEGKSGEPEIFREVKLDGLDREKFVAKQVFFPSKDGTKIPMFIVHRKDLVLDGSAPSLLYGYGGFNCSLLPSFSVFRLAFVNHFNGVFALANIRGGGEYGEAWQNAGRLLNRQNCFDDFIAAAEHLISEKYTSSKNLTVMGGSHGGMLVGACINQRPELYGSAIAMVGVMDMLRFHKFTIGYAWCTDYGTPDEKEHFDSIIKYSPLHNIKVPDGDVQYPATLVQTADHDDRVVPLHSFKYVAELQHTAGSSDKQKNPLLIRIDVKAGHSAGMPTSKIIDEYTDIMTFMAKSLNLKYIP